MKFLADENVREPIISALRADGHTVLSIAETSPGIDDVRVLEMARKTESVLLTHDLGISELVFRRRLPPLPGIMQLRFPSRMRYSEMARLVVAVVRTGANFRGQIATITRRRVRFEPLPPNT